MMSESNPVVRTTKRRRWLPLGAFFFALALGCVVWASRAQNEPQYVALPDGRVFRFVSATWGTNHVQPRIVAWLAEHLPKSSGNSFRKKLEARFGPLDSHTTLEPSLCLWFVLVPSNNLPSNNLPATPIRGRAGVSPSVECGLADKDGKLGGRRSGGTWNGVSNAPFVAAEFLWVPRRRPILKCIIFDQLTTRANSHEIASISFPNPLFGKFPQWQPEALPAVKKAGDIEIRLSSVTHGPTMVGLTYFDAEIVSDSGSGSGWELDSAVLSDATGNRILGKRLGDSKAYRSRNYGESVLGTLWPEENAWKLALEIKNTNEPAPAELVSFKSVPVPPAPTINTPAIDVGMPSLGRPASPPLLTNIIDGQRIVLVYITNTVNILSSDAIPFPGVRVELPDKPSGFALDFVSAVTDTGTMVEKIRDSGDNSFLEVQFQRLPAQAKTVDLTFRLQRTRTVEFLFHPPPSN